MPSELDVLRRFDKLSWGDFGGPRESLKSPLGAVRSNEFSPAEDLKSLPDVVQSDDISAEGEQKKVKKLQGIGAASPPLQVKPPVPPGISSVSSLEKAAAPEISTRSALSPKLAQPVHYVYPIAELFNRVERIMSKLSYHMKDQLENTVTQLSRLSDEMLQKIRERAREMAAMQTWDAFSTVLQYIASSTSIVIGASLVATGVGAIAGGFMIAAGGLGLVNRAMTDFGIWHKLAGCFTKSIELQQQYAQLADWVVSGVALVVSMASLICAYQAGSLALKAGEFSQKFASAVNGGAAAAQSVTQVGSALSYKNGLYASAALRRLGAEEFSVRQDSRKIISDLTEVQKTGETMNGGFNKIVRMSSHNVE